CYIDGDDTVYVAKKFFDTGNEPVGGTPVVSKQDNDIALAKDLARLKRLAMFREKYMELAAIKNFMEIANFEVSDAFLISVQAAEAIKDTGSSDDEAGSFANSTYLVEPFRSSSVVRKFSGTLGSTADTDKLANTMLSFAHFVLEHTACAMAMVDLQGSLHAVPGTLRTMVLFDPMSHTASEDSGVGDFGFIGITDAIDNHECNLFCRALGLCTKGVLEDTLAKQKWDYAV
ncbi:kinase-like domain-containing protein, partial [Mycena vitilis]